MRFQVTLAALGLAAFTSFPAVSQQSSAARARAEVLVLGVYHMNNPGRDVFNTEIDDVLSPKRQADMRIYTNIVQLVESPDERVLVIYGSGHLGWLQYAFDSNPNFRLRKLAEFAR